MGEGLRCKKGRAKGKERVKGTQRATIRAGEKGKG